jgi:hypothetical protein
MVGPKAVLRAEASEDNEWWWWLVCGGRDGQWCSSGCDVVMEAKRNQWKKEKEGEKKKETVKFQFLA